MPERRTRRDALAAGRTRRDALAAALGGAAALALAPAVAAARGADEGAILTALVRAEEDAVFVYRNGAVAEIGGLPAGHDREHARALASHLEALGMPIPGPTRGRDDLGTEALAVVEARDPGTRFRAALAYERSLIDGCARSLAALEQPNTIRTVATVMASHAQHEAEFERRLGIVPFSSRS
jgi:hypothetical protein